MDEPNRPDEPTAPDESSPDTLGSEDTTWSADPPQDASQPAPPGVWSPATLDSHITIVGALYLASSILGILLALGLSMAIIGGGLISGEEEAITATSIVGCCLGGALLAFSLPGLLGGIFLMKRRRWARILILVLGFLSLLAIPLGTALGAYTIWVLLKPEADEAFH